MIVVALAWVTPASAADPQLETYCFRQAEQVRPVLTEPEKEAYIANCIANNTPTPPVKKHSY
jgi:hypothetical protein